MTREQENKIIKLAANWSPEFLLKKIDEIIVKLPIKYMLKRKISKSILEEMDEYSDELKNDIVLHNTLDDLKKIKYAKDIIKENKSLLLQTSTNLYYEIISEIKEIEEDYKWERTKRGQLVLEIDEWIERANCSLPDNSKETLLIGRNVMDDDPCNIIVGGYSNVITYAEIKSIVMSLNPPVKPFFIFPQTYELDGN